MVLVELVGVAPVPLYNTFHDVWRLLAAGGELLTLVSGAAAEPGLVEELRSRALERSDSVGVETIAGGQDRYLVLIGVE